MVKVKVMGSVCVCVCVCVRVVDEVRRDERGRICGWMAV